MFINSVLIGELDLEGDLSFERDPEEPGSSTIVIRLPISLKNEKETVQEVQRINRSK